MRQFKMHYLILSFGLLTGITEAVQAQVLKRHTGSYLLNNVLQGTVDYQWKELEGDSILHGRFKFSALDAERCVEYDSWKVNIQGEYKNGQKDGKWVVEDEKYHLQVNDIDRLAAQTGLNGTQRKLNIQYKDGLPHGKWTISFLEVQNSKFRGGRILTTANFVEGNIAGEFRYTSTGQNPINVQGKFDELGRFDGQWQLNYLLNNLPVEEIRLYEAGFLLEARLSKNKGEIKRIEYNDVKNQLSSIASGRSNGYSQGDEMFGIVFENGYPEFDERMLIQQKGNEVLETVLDQYLQKGRLHRRLTGSTRPVVGGTRRFKFVYPAYEKPLLDALLVLSNKLETKFDSLLSDKRFIINLQNYDSLSFFYSYVEQAQGRIKRVKNVADAIAGGRFDYEDRNNYYNVGVQGLQQFDTVTYTYQGRNKAIPIDYGLSINRPDSLVYKLHKSLQNIENRSIEFANYIYQLFTSIRQEQRIEEIDAQIIQYLDSVNIRFTGTARLEPNITDGELAERHQMQPLEVRFYRQLVLNHARALVNDYAKTTESDKKIEKGTELNALYQKIYVVHPLLMHLAEMPVVLDSAFTRYSKNPFMDRQAESRIKTNIYSKGVGVLMPQLINQMIASKSAVELDKNVTEVYHLYHRLMELSSRDDQEVDRINARIRRENVPERIKRTLGL